MHRFWNNIKHLQMYYRLYKIVQRHCCLYFYKYLQLYILKLNTCLNGIQAEVIVVKSHIYRQHWIWAQVYLAVIRLRFGISQIDCLISIRRYKHWAILTLTAFSSSRCSDCFDVWSKLVPVFVLGPMFFPRLWVCSWHTSVVTFLTSFRACRGLVYNFLVDFPKAKQIWCD